MWSSYNLPTTALKFRLSVTDVGLVIAKMTTTTRRASRRAAGLVSDDYIMIMHEHGYGWVLEGFVEAVQ